MLKLIFQNSERSQGKPQQPPQDELKDLAAAAAQGDARAIRTLVHAVGPHLLRTVRAVLGRDHSAIEDVAQEAVVELIGSLARFRGDASVTHYACRVAVMCALHHRRKESAQKRALSLNTNGHWPQDADESSSEEPNPEACVDTNRCSTVVLELVSSLPKIQAEAFALHVILGYTVSEVADVLAVPTETVRSRLRLSRQVLRKKFQTYPMLREVLEGT